MSKAYSVGDQIADIMDDYAKEVKEQAQKSCQTAAKDTANELKNTSPKRTGDYARGWSVKKDGEGFIVYNRTNGQLTHLLEFGHAKVNGGRVNAIEHIGKAAQNGERELMADIERSLK